jgi:hypothetical protein
MIDLLNRRYIIDEHTSTLKHKKFIIKKEKKTEI